jgi:hypothetical protein
MYLSHRSATANDVYPYVTEEKEVPDQHAQACHFRSVKEKRDYKVALAAFQCGSEEALYEVRYSAVAA